MNVTPVTLEGAAVRLEPLTLEHLEPLVLVGLDPALWRWTTTVITTPDAMREYVATALAAGRAGTALPFTTVERASGTVVGSTRLANIDRANRHAEIGWTWVAPAWQRTAINTEAKLLLLRHAFEALGCLRVELKTDALNAVSRSAIERIGGRFEGIFRKHMVLPDRVRDTAWYSIVDDEWPEVRRRLEERLRTGAGRGATGGPAAARES